MNHFEDPHLRTRKLPKKGDIIWLVPIRYWELNDYSPEKMHIESVTPSGESFFGFHHGYGHDVYVSITDCKWYWKEEHARRAQGLLAVLSDLLDDDDMVPIMKETMLDIERRKAKVEAEIAARA